MLAGPVLLGRAWGLGWTTPVLGAVLGFARRSELGTDLGPSLVDALDVAAEVAAGRPLAPLVDIAAMFEFLH